MDLGGNPAEQLKEYQNMVMRNFYLTFFFCILPGLLHSRAIGSEMKNRIFLALNIYKKLCIWFSDKRKSFPKVSSPRRSITSGIHLLLLLNFVRVVKISLIGKPSSSAICIETHCQSHCSKLSQCSDLIVFDGNLSSYSI